MQSEGLGCERGRDPDPPGQVEFHGCRGTSVVLYRLLSIYAIGQEIFLDGADWH